MDADIHTLYSYDFYTINDFRCRCTDCRTSKAEYSDSLCIAFVRKGNFLFNVFRHTLDSHTGCALVTKPGYEHTVTHTHTVPDECTIFDFKQEFYHEIVAHFKAGDFFLNVIVDVFILIGIAVNAVANKIQLQFYIVFYKTTPTHAQTAFPEPGKILALEYGAEKKNRNDYKGRFHNKKVAKF